MEVFGEQLVDFKDFLTNLKSLKHNFSRPVEGQPIWLRFISYCTPITILSMSFRNIMIKGYGITDPSVYNGVIILLIWMVVSIVFAMYILKKRKFSDNMN